MYALITLYMDSWSGPEYGPTLYFRNEAEAVAYRRAYHAKYNTAARAPECYTTYENRGFVWVDEETLKLQEDALGLHCRVVKTV